MARRTRYQRDYELAIEAERAEKRAAAESRRRSKAAKLGHKRRRERLRLEARQARDAAGGGASLIRELARSLGWKVKAGRTKRDDKSTGNHRFRYELKAPPLLEVTTAEFLATWERWVDAVYDRAGQVASDKVLVMAHAPDPEDTNYSDNGRWSSLASALAFRDAISQAQTSLEEWTKTFTTRGGSDDLEIIDALTFVIW